MDFEQDNNFSGSPESPLPKPVSGSSPDISTAKAKKKGRGWRLFWGIFLALSVIANIVLFLMLIGIVAVFATGQMDIFTEHVIEDGPRTSKIAVINLQGVIDSQRAQDIYSQLKHARKDENVKGLILRIDSPGGTISGSDRIHNEINKYRDETEKPVVAFMHNIAASGGYYVSVACDKIVAEPTTITGSVGVILGYLVLQELLEGKLGIQPVIVKSGEKKDWPSSFHPPTEEQLQYLEDKVITPFYERFVKIVSDGRTALSLEDVKRLSDGSIYGAEEALDEQLIDKIGYLDDAIESVMSLAGIEDAQVVEYRRPFSLTGFLSSCTGNILNINRTTLYELSTPQVLYLWSIF